MFRHMRAAYRLGARGGGASYPAVWGTFTRWGRCERSTADTYELVRRAAPPAPPEAGRRGAARSLAHARAGGRQGTDARRRALRVAAVDRRNRASAPGRLAAGR